MTVLLPESEKLRSPDGCLHVGTIPHGRIEYPLLVMPDELLKNTLFMGQSGSGKSTVLFRMLRYLLMYRPEVPALVLDGSRYGTLAKNLFLWWHTWLDQWEARYAEQAQTLAPGLRDRVLYMKLEEHNRCGVSFNLGDHLATITTTGEHDVLSVKELTAALLGTLTYMSEDSEMFKLIHRYAKAGFGVLFAAGRPAKEIEKLYDLRGTEYRAGLLRRLVDRGYEVERDDHEDEEDLFVAQQWRVVDSLFVSVGKSGEALMRHVGSTLRHFQWVSDDFQAFFNRPVVRLDHFIQRGGVLLVETCGRDPQANANARAAIYAMYQSALTGKSRKKPAVTVIDEQNGLNAKLYADYVAAAARNSGNFHWFSLHSTQQLRDEFPTIWQACQRKVIGSIAEEELARLVLMHTDDLRLDRMYLETATVTETQSEDESETRTRTWRSSRTFEPRRTRSTIEGRYDLSRRRPRHVLGGEAKVYDLRARTTRYKKALDPFHQPIYPGLEGFGGDPAYFEYERVDDTKTLVVRQDDEHESFSDGEDEGEAAARRRGTSTSVTTGTERISLSELITLFSRDLLNQPIGRAIHIEPGQPAYTVDHAYEPLPLDAPDAETDVARRVSDQAARLAADWDRRNRRPCGHLAEPRCACTPPRADPGDGPAFLR